MPTFRVPRAPPRFKFIEVSPVDQEILTNYGASVKRTKKAGAGAIFDASPSAAKRTTITDKKRETSPASAGLEEPGNSKGGAAAESSSSSKFANMNEIQSIRIRLGLKMRPDEIFKTCPLSAAYLVCGKCSQIVWPGKR